MLTRVLLRRDTTENWTKYNPVLAQGELGVDTTSNLIKLGDGEKTWNELDYYSNSSVVVPTKTSQLTNDSDFITSVALNQYPTASEVTEALETKQDVLVAEDGKVPTNLLNVSNSITSESTENELVSAKAVYDLVGNLESLLAEI